MQILSAKQTGRMPKPAPRYAKLAAELRAIGVDIADNEYEKLDGVIESARRRYNNR